MRTLLIFLSITAVSALAQPAIRVDPTPVMTTAGTVTPGGYPSLYAVPGALVTLYADAGLTTLPQPTPIPPKVRHAPLMPK